MQKPWYYIKEVSGVVSPLQMVFWWKDTLFKELRLQETTENFSFPEFSVASTMGWLNSGDHSFYFFFSRLLYPGIVTFVIASCTFPPGMGQFMAGEVSRKGVWGWSQVTELMIGTKPGLGHMEKGKQHRCPSGFWPRTKSIHERRAEGTLEKQDWKSVL